MNRQISPCSQLCWSLPKRFHMMFPDAAGVLTIYLACWQYFWRVDNISFWLCLTPTSWTKLGFTTFNVLKVKFPESFAIFMAHGEQTQSKIDIFFSQQVFPSFKMLVCIETRFRVCVDWPNYDSSASREPRGVLEAAFKFVRHGCKLPLLSSPSNYPNPWARALACSLGILKYYLHL